MRAYEKSHPWLTFELNLSPAPPELWLLLGEARSKFDHIAGVPLRPETARELNRLFLAKGALATTAIEGNTLSEEEVVKLLEGKLRLPASRQYLAKEVDNIVQACNSIVKRIEAGQPSTLTPGTVKEFNRQVLEGLELESGVVPGRIREHSVSVGNYPGVPAQDCEHLLSRLCEWLSDRGFKPDGQLKPYRLGFAVLKAIVAHVYLAWIHPFGDGNGRTARLVELQILFSSGVPMPAAHLLSNHYNQTRAEYYRQLAHASRKGGDIIPFVLYALRGLVDGLRSELGLIREQQWDVAWRSHIHELFMGQNGGSAERRKHLVLDLSMKSEPVQRSSLRDMSPRIASAYATKTDMTLTRDLNELLRMGLIRKTPKGWVARRETILAFLPPRGMETDDELSLQQDLPLELLETA